VSMKTAPRTMAKTVITIMIVDARKDEIPEVEVRRFVDNIAYTYNTRAVQEGNTFRIEITEELRGLKGLGLIQRFYDTYHQTFRELTAGFTRTVQSRGQPTHQPSLVVTGPPRKAIFCARILSPLIRVHVPFLEAMNLLFSRLHFGLFMEMVDGGLVFYVNDRRGLDFIARFFDPKIVDYANEHLALLDADPKQFFAEILRIAGLGGLLK
jgi:hypothetical protein